MTSMQHAGEVLRGRQVMVVEDEMLLAMELEILLTDLGCGVIGPVPSVDRALALLDQQRPDAAVLDVNLNGQTALPVAAALNAQHVPFLLATGYTDALQAELQDAPRIGKPVNHTELMRALVQILDASA
jgi:two-component SAPR family response regulator